MSRSQINVRVPSDLKQWLAIRAAENSRTICGEVLAILKDAKDRKGGDKQAHKLNTK